MLNFKIDTNKIDKIGKFTKEEKDFRIKNLNYFNDIGFPIKEMKTGNFQI